MKTTLIQAIASTVDALHTCEKRENGEAMGWSRKHRERLRAMEQELPSGSGFDSGTRIDIERSSMERVVLTTSYHHMNEHGMYDGWTNHTIIVTPSFHGVLLRITGRERYRSGGWKDYAYDVFYDVLTREYIEPAREEAVNA
jgi:hypothetical protein